MSSFNGGKIQAQSQTLLQGGDYPFINILKTMQEWTSGGGVNTNPDHLDVNGYLKATGDTVSNVVFGPPSKMDGVTKWVFTYDGRGNTNVALQAGGSVTITNGASFDNTSGAASNRVEFTIPTNLDGSLNVGVFGIASTSDYPHNMKLFLLSDEADQTAGFITTAKFRNLLKGNVGVLRDLNWAGTANFSNVTNWASRKSSTFYSYNATEYRGSAWGAGAWYIPGGTAGTGDAFTATISGSSGVSPVHNQIVQVQFDHDSVGTSWTFALNGTAALPMSEALVPDYITAENFAPPRAGNIATLVFDADLQLWWKYGGSSGGHFGVNSGVPPEVFVQVCDEIGAHPYFVCPPLAADPVTDYMTQIDAYMQASGSAWMIPRYEGPNENWNGGFFANTLSIKKAQFYWNTSNNGNYHWCGWMSSKLGQALAAGRASPKVGYQFIVGVASQTWLSGTTPSNPRLNSPRSNSFKTATFTNGSASISVPGNSYALNDKVCFAFLSSSNHGPTYSGGTISEEKTYFVRSTGTSITISDTSGGTAFGAFTIIDATVFSIIPGNSPAYNWATTVACTQYANPNTQNQPAEIAYGYRLQAGDTSVISTYASDNDMGPTGLRLSYDAWYAWANSFGVAMKMCGYEGGWSPDYISGSVGGFGVISGATNANPCVLTITQVNRNNFASPDLVSGNGCVTGMPVGIGVTGMPGFNLAAPKNITFSTGTPGTVNYGSAHGFSAGQVISFAVGKSFMRYDSKFDTPQITGGTGFIVPCIAYYVKDAAPGGDTTKFTISATNGGAAIAVTALQGGSAVMTVAPAWLITNVSGNSITVNVDSSNAGVFGTYASGDNELIYGGTYDPGGNGGSGRANMIDAIRIASKTSASLRADTLTNYQQFILAGGEFPSCFQIAGQNNAWSVWDPDIYASPTPPQWLGVLDFNAVASTITAAFSVMQDNSRYLVKMIGY